MIGVCGSGVWLVGALVLVVALGSGCLASKETRNGAKELRDRLGTPSWASSVDGRARASTGGSSDSRARHRAAERRGHGC